MTRFLSTSMQAASQQSLLAYRNLVDGLAQHFGCHGLQRAPSTEKRPVGTCGRCAERLHLETVGRAAHVVDGIRREHRAVVHAPLVGSVANGVEILLQIHSATLVVKSRGLGGDDALAGALRRAGKVNGHAAP